MKRLLHLVNDVSLGWFAAALALSVLAYGFGFWMLAQGGSIVFTFDGGGQPDFFDCLYFSMVTISSLGYGDMRPTGLARLLVGMEVITGLAYFGLLVAKISSVKQDYILQRMYTEAVDTKLEKYTRELDEQRTLYRITSRLLISGEIDPELTTTFRRDMPGATFFSLFRQLMQDVTDLMVYEAGNGALFGHVDDSRLDSIYDAIRGVLRRTTTMWERDKQAACDFVLCDNAEDLTHICSLAEKLAQLGRKNSKNPSILQLCEAILDLSAKVRAEVLPEI